MAYTYDKIPCSRAGITYIFTMSGTSQPSSAFGPQTYQIRVATEGQQAWIKIGDGSVTADSTSSMLLGTNLVDYFTVTPGQKIAFLQAGTAGRVSVTEMS